MGALHKLGMEKNWIYEVVISSYNDNVPNAAPFGIKTKNFELIEIDMYKGSNTLKSILSGRDFAINTVPDTALFYDALYAKESVKYGLAKVVSAPVITDAPVSIEARVIDTTTTDQRVIITADVLYVHYRYDAELVNRAKSLLLESLILSTRMSHFSGGKVEAMIKENFRVVKKVSPGSEYQAIMQELINKFCG